MGIVEINPVEFLPYFPTLTFQEREMFFIEDKRLIPQVTYIFIVWWLSVIEFWEP